MASQLQGSSTNTTRNRTAPAPPSAPKQLSCINCRRKKVKCDRRYPCGQCTEYDVRCIVPQRRSPWPTRRSNLKARSASDSDVDNSNDHPWQSSPTELAWPIAGESGGTRPQPCQEVAPSRRSILGGTFWESICSEVEGLDDGLDHNLGCTGHPFQDPNTSSTPTDPLSFGGVDWLLAPPPAAVHDSIASPSAIRTLSDIFLANVDPVFKILHRPTLHRAVAEYNASVSSLSPQAAASRRALLSAVCFAAVTSLSDADCLQILGSPRHDVVCGWSRDAQSVLSAADPLVTSDFTVLQALTIYSMAIRSHDVSRRTYVLVTMTIRLTQAAGVHREQDVIQHSVFEQEMRRRLWAQLLVLDMRCAEDRALEPLISPSQHDTKLPANVNDEDFGPHTTAPLVSRRGTTQMTYSLASARVSILANAVSSNAAPLCDIAGLNGKMQQIASGIEGLESRSPPGHGDGGESEASLHNNGAHMLVQVVTFKLWLYLHYPVYARFPAFPTTAEQESRILVMATSALLLLEKLDSNRMFSRFNWFLSTFIPWHPLAVALTKMCSQTDGTVHRKSWPFVSRAYERCNRLIADGSSGTLWRHIERLFQRAHISMIVTQPMVIPPSLKALGRQEEVAAFSRLNYRDDNYEDRPEELEGENSWSFDAPCYFL